MKCPSGAGRPPDQDMCDNPGPCLQTHGPCDTAGPVHRNAGCDHEQSALKELAMAGVPCSVKGSFGNLSAQDVVPMAEAVLKTTAGYQAVPPSLLLIPPTTAQSGHAAAPPPSPVLCQPDTLMPQISSACTMYVGPDRAAVLNASAESIVWQNQQKLQPWPLAGHSGFARCH